ncbi:hypothetical protein ACUM5Y_03830 [Marinomonas dokdonensis]|uniref:hypothetical protein n=1 Tax=Marinomonas dokdonensis TaxID=328224 RepID=UPI0040553AF7
MIRYCICFFALLLVACNSQPTKDNEVVKPTLPDWVTSPPNTGELAVAIVPKQSDPEQQLRVAILEAKAQLAKNRSVQVSNELETVSSRNGSNIHSSYISDRGVHKSLLITNFSDAKVIDEYHAENGDLYILYGFSQ